MIEKAELEGKIQPGKTILIEGTSGNMGECFVTKVKLDSNLTQFLWRFKIFIKGLHSHGLLQLKATKLF